MEAVGLPLIRIAPSFRDRLLIFRPPPLIRSLSSSSSSSPSVSQDAPWVSVGLCSLNSSQSRADILALALAVTDVLTGLVWLSIRPKDISPVVPQGVECKRISPEAPQYAVRELLWTWESLSATTCCRSLIIVYEGSCLLQIGSAAESSMTNGDAVVVDVYKLMQGSLYRNIMKSGKQSYLANLSLYPARSELPFLPLNTQAAMLQPLGDKGIAVIGGDMIRGFSNLDQAWITLIAEKLDTTLSKA